MKLPLGTLIIVSTLAGCTSSNLGGFPNSVSVVDATQQQTHSLCQFVPTAQTILGILNLSVPALSTAAQIATAICEALTRSQPSSGGAIQEATNVQGVKIEGYRTRS